MRKFLLFVLVALGPACASRSDVGSLGSPGTGMGISGIGVGGSEGSRRDVVASDLNGIWLTTPGPDFRATIETYDADILPDVLNTEIVFARSTGSLASAGPEPDIGAEAAQLDENDAADVHGSGTNAQAAALQIAIMEALDHQAAYLKKGDVAFIDQIATSWLDTRPGRNDHSDHDPTTSPTPVPEPGVLPVTVLYVIVLLGWRGRYRVAH